MDHLDLSLDNLFRPQYFPSSITFAKGDDFFAIPERFGWSESTETFSDPQTSFNAFLQQWLFFGLLHTVLQDDQFRENEFVMDDRINTKRLKHYLSTWEQRANAGDKGMTMRMIKAQLALDRARDVVSRYCSLEWKKWETNDSTISPDKVDPSLALSLLVLGETLTNAKCRIVERVGFTIRGWHGDANEGWGVPSAVVRAMHQAGWCKRTIYVLGCQLRSHATALLAAYKAYGEIELRERSFNILQGHIDCTKDECVFKSTKEDKKTYKPRHRWDCRKPSECSMRGPKVEQVVAAINKGQTPLLQYDERNSRVNVKPHEAFETHATISHVWSDGHGNRETTELAECQLKYISGLIEKSRWYDKSQEFPLFWIDTLAIPRHGKYDAERKKAVSRIDEVYRNAKFTIVLDLGLDHIIPGSQYYEIAIRVLASGWMRRLWTLQEAYLSQRILFAFRDQKLVEVDEIEDKYSDTKHSLASNLATSARTYFYHIMGPERRSRIFNVPPENKYDVISSVWRSAQWRTIQRKSDETVVLRALFELNRKRASSMRETSDTQNEPVVSRVNIKDPHNPTEEDRAEMAIMMKDLWTSLDEQSPGCIPSGIIFLPGARLPLPGFGWAPRSWMSGKEIDHPDPLALPQSKATLIHGRGLSVTYPGFLLHYKKSDTVFWPNDKPVQFPCDSTLLEWYEVERADHEETPKGMKLERMRFAILLCRPKPRERPEIALLVNITNEIHQGLHGSSAISKLYKAQIVCRVWIKREIKIDRSSKWQEFKRQTGETGEDFICGEELNSDQEWLVDGFPKEQPHFTLTPRERLSPVEIAPTVNSLMNVAQDVPTIFRGNGRVRGPQPNRRQKGQASTGPREASRTASVGGPLGRAATFNDSVVGTSSGPTNSPNGRLMRRTTDLDSSRGRGSDQRGRPR